MVILENIDIDIDIDKEILENIDIESIRIWHIEQGYNTFMILAMIGDN